MTTTAGDLEVLRLRMRKALNGFGNGLPEEASNERLRAYDPGVELFPVPELVLFALREVMGFRWSGPEENVRWKVWTELNGHLLGFALRRNGFRILCRRDVPHDVLGRASRQLSASLKHLEPLLSKYADGQILRGNLTLANRMTLLDDRYRFFRKLADDSFAAAEMADAEDDPDIFKAIEDFMEKRIGGEQEGFFASGAMVDGWFSGLEHRMLLLRAFLGKPLKPGEFKSFLGKKWDKRLAILLDDAGQSEGQVLSRLRKLKKTVRNPLAHGGVENDGGSFHFHLPKVGAIPANLSKHRARVRMSFFPISPSGHGDACAIFDAADALLSGGPFELPHQFVRWGVEPSFDSHSLELFRNAIAGGAAAVETLIERIGRQADRHHNMEY